MALIDPSTLDPRYYSASTLAGLRAKWDAAHPVKGSPAAGDIPWELQPGAHPGAGPYGLVPGSIGLPPVAKQLAGLFPNLQPANDKVSANVMASLRGELSPETIAAIQDEAARFGVSSGVPLSDFSGSRGLRNLGLSVEGTQRQGLKDYLAAITGIRDTQMVNPALQSEIADRNARFAAAPDPKAAANEAERLYQAHLQQSLDLGRTGPSVSYPGMGGGGPGTTNRNNTFMNQPWGAVNTGGNFGGTAPPGGGFNNVNSWGGGGGPAGGTGIFNSDNDAGFGNNFGDPWNSGNNDWDWDLSDGNEADQQDWE